MQLNRRDMLTLSAIGASSLMLAPNITAAEKNNSDLEARNLKMMEEFCDIWSTMDQEKIMSYFSDDIKFRMTESSPLVEGKAALAELLKQFLSARTSARFELIRHQAMGNILINERIDHFERADGKDAFHMTGLFFIKEGKIVEWWDYVMPKDA